MKRILLIFSLVIFFFFSPKEVWSHPGNTAADGCHYCRTNCDYWGVAWNVRHCHGGYTAPAPTKAPVVYTPTPKPSTPKPTIHPTQTSILIPSATPTPTLTLEPEVKSATIENENTPIPTVQPEKTEVNTKDALLGLGIFASMVGGSFWIIRKIIKKIISIFRK